MCVFQKKLLLVNEMLLFPIALLVVLGPTMPESHNEFESLVLNILCGNLGGLCVWFVCSNPSKSKLHTIRKREIFFRQRGVQSTFREREREREKRKRCVRKS